MVIRAAAEYHFLKGIWSVSRRKMLHQQLKQTVLSVIFGPNWPFPRHLNPFKNWEIIQRKKTLKTNSILEEFDINIEGDIPVDPMHLVYLDVVQTIINL